MPSFTELNNKNFKDKFLLQWEGSDVRITESRLSATGGGKRFAKEFEIFHGLFNRYIHDRSIPILNINNKTELG